MMVCDLAWQSCHRALHRHWPSFRSRSAAWCGSAAKTWRNIWWSRHVKVLQVVTRCNQAIIVVSSKLIISMINQWESSKHPSCIGECQPFARKWASFSRQSEVSTYCLVCTSFHYSKHGPSGTCDQDFWAIRWHQCKQDVYQAQSNSRCTVQLIDFGPSPTSP